MRIASWAEQPITLAQDSVTGRAQADLVDVGAGTSEADYAGRDVRGKLVLTSSQPEAVARLAVTQRGAAGIVSWAQNQRSAWWGEDESLIRWGHLSTWEDPTFAFMVSPAQARAWQARLARGEAVRLRAEVKAGRSPGAYLIPTAVIPGKNRLNEIVFSCHLDHPSPGANDNASGCSGILEIARSLNRLVAEKRLPQPERTLRFIWPCEIECTIALLNARPEFGKRTLATVHLDMIGGNTEVTKGTLKVEGSPPSLPSFVSDIGFAIARWVDDQSLRYANTGTAAMPLLEADGTKLPLRAQIGGFSEGSDHQVWAEGSWRIPVIYLADWPDIYIHTNKDVPGNLDSTKMKRGIYIAAASAWYLANLNRWTDSASLVSPAVEATGPSDGPIYRRNPKLKGPMNGFGYSWLDDHLKKAGLERPALLSRQPVGDGPSFGYETLNLVDGKRTVQQIRDRLAATVAPAPVEEVAAYLATLERLGVVERAGK
ncbi:MAG TPA: M28 family peptidase [Allosphingosinicella sp.]